MSDNDEIQNKTNANIAGKPEFVEFGFFDFCDGEMWYMPRLHYLVAKTGTRFVALNLELQLFASGNSQDEAAKSLSSLIISHVKAVTKRGDFSQLIEEAKSNIVDGYWCKYREMEFIAAQKAFNNRKKDAFHTILK